LDGTGYAICLPVLLVCWFWWWRTTASKTSTRMSFVRKLCIRRGKWHPLVYLVVVCLSLAGGILYTPWGFDSTTYRLPRILYWWAHNGWYWIGTLDHRLDFSSCGFEWQMLPVIVATRTDRFLFLLNWLPFLLIPGLTFLAFHTLGVRRRTAWNWMWLLPTGYCIALQSSSLQNDGYAINYVLAAIAFAGLGFRTRNPVFTVFAILSAALLTGAKLSNVLLLLPLGLCLVPALLRTRFFLSPAIASLVLAALVSFLPLAFLCVKYTGDWTGDPEDQWHVHPASPIGCAAANTILLVNDTLQPPICPMADHLNGMLRGINSTESSFLRWLRWSHHEFNKVKFAPVVYEGSVGMGFGIGLYVVFLITGQFFIKKTGIMTRRDEGIPILWKLAPWSAWLAYIVFLSKVGMAHTPRHAATYYPFLLISLLRMTKLARLDASGIGKAARMLAALSVIPIMLLTPIRPLVPAKVVSGVLSALKQNSQAETMRDYYKFWAGLRDDLAPMRDQLPRDEKVIGYAGAFKDTCYALWKPLGSRAFVELGLPPGKNKKIPAGIHYAVVTESGIKQRYQMELSTWLQTNSATPVFEFQHKTSLAAHEKQEFETWYLVQIRKP
jgi:hypothetical protein